MVALMPEIHSRQKGFSSSRPPPTPLLSTWGTAATHRPSTLTRRLTSINKVHRAAGHPAPAVTEHLSVGETLKGIRRVHGTEPAAKHPLFTGDLRAMVDTLPRGLIGTRDRALLLVGFAGAFRRSELAPLRWRMCRRPRKGSSSASRAPKPIPRSTPAPACERASAPRPI